MARVIERRSGPRQISEVINGSRVVYGGENTMEAARLSLQVQQAANDFENTAAQAIDDVNGLKNEAAASAATALAAAGSATEDFNTRLFDILRQLYPSVTGTLLTSTSLTQTSPSDLSFEQVPVLRFGFDGTGQTTEVVDRMFKTKRIRQPWPNHESFTDDEVALSDFVDSGDVVLGLRNTSTSVSPKPIANWTMPAHLVVGDSIDWEMAAFHRDGRPDPVTGVGRQVACVRVRATDGTNSTAWQVKAVTALSSGLVEEAQPTEVFKGTLDISGLSDGAAGWLEGEVLPWIGTEASILKSEEVASRRGFSRRWFRRDTAIAGTPPLAYVASTGDNGTGVISTTASTADASPFLTVGGAIDAARSQLGTTRGAIDGLRIRIVDTVNLDSPNVSFTNYQNVGAVIIERAPGTARATAIVATNKPFRPMFTDHENGTEGQLIFHDVTLRVGAATHKMKGEASNRLFTQFWNTAIDYNLKDNNFRSDSDIAFFGMVANNFVGGLSTSAAGNIRMMRGVEADFNGTNYCGWNVIGCALSNVGGGLFQDATEDGHIFYNNDERAIGSEKVPFSFSAASSGDDLGSIAVVQNVIEMTSADAATGMRISADGAFGNVTHAVVIHNTIAGAAGNGRFNIAYVDRDPTDDRVHDNFVFKGNLGPQFNMKSDIFSGSQGYADASTRTGNFPTHHGTGLAGNFSENANAGGGGISFGFAYPGLGTVIAGGDALFVDRQSVTGPSGSFTAGAGGGDYHLQAGSPARGILLSPLLGFDHEGAVRAAGAQAAGAYV